MIRIEVQEYCSECCDFEPDVTKPVKLVGSKPFTGITLTDTVVKCRYAKRCESIKRYLEHRNNENGSVRP